MRQATKIILYFHLFTILYIRNFVYQILKQISNDLFIQIKKNGFKLRKYELNIAILLTNVRFYKKMLKFNICFFTKIKS